MKVEEILNPLENKMENFDDLLNRYSLEELQTLKQTLSHLGISLVDIFAPPRYPHEFINGTNKTQTLTLSSSGLSSELSCPICLNTSREVLVVKECLHRFCSDCIQKWLRSSHQDCPQCRIKIPSRRSLRSDWLINGIISRLSPDAEKFARENSELISERADFLTGHVLSNSAHAIKPEEKKRRTSMSRMVSLPDLGTPTSSQLPFSVPHSETKARPSTAQPLSSSSIPKSSSLSALPTVHVHLCERPGPLTSIPASFSCNQFVTLNRSVKEKVTDFAFRTFYLNPEWSIKQLGGRIINQLLEGLPDLLKGPSISLLMNKAHLNGDVTISSLYEGVGQMKFDYRLSFKSSSSKNETPIKNDLIALPKDEVPLSPASSSAFTGLLKDDSDMDADLLR